MKAIHVTYSRTISLIGNDIERIEISLAVEDGENEQDVLDAAKRFVKKNIFSPQIGFRDIESARRILSSPEKYTVREIIEARNLLSSLD